MSQISGLSGQELAVLLATRESDNAKTLVELAQLVEASPERVGATLDGLCAKGILYPEECFDDIRYAYPDTEIAQDVYAEIFDVERF